MLGAIKFKVERRIDDPDAVWSRLSDLEQMPRYWGGHRVVRIVGRRSGILQLEIQFAFPGPLNRGRAEAAVDEANREVLINYIDGPFTGVVKNYVRGDVVASEWDILLKPLFLPMKPWVVSHFRKGAENALERLAKGNALP